MSRYRYLLVIGMVVATFAFTGSTRAQQATQSVPAPACSTPSASGLPTPPGFVHRPAEPAARLASSVPTTNTTLSPRAAAHQPASGCCGGTNNYWAYQEIANPQGSTGTSTYSGTYLSIDGENDNPAGMPGNIYQWIGSYETVDNLFIQDGLAVLPNNVFEFFAYQQTGSTGGLPVTCYLGTPSFDYGGGPQGCLAPISAFHTSPGNYAGVALCQAGQTIYFNIYTDSWHTFMSTTDPNTAANGFGPAFLVQEYAALPSSSDITTLVSSDNPPLKMREHYEYVWQTVAGVTSYVTTLTAGFDYYQLRGTSPQSYGGPDPVCPPFEQFATNYGSYTSYFVGTWGDSHCPSAGAAII